MNTRPSSTALWITLGLTWHLLFATTSLAADASSSVEAARAAPRPSTQFSVSGAVLHPGAYDLAALLKLPTTTQTAAGKTYTGVALWHLLSQVAGLQVDPAAKSAPLWMYVVATGSDGYRAVFSLAELDPAFGNQPDLVAYAVDGAGLGQNGFARIVVPHDGKGGRYVANLVSIEVFVAPSR